jgi:hypothetical protein
MAVWPSSGSYSPSEAAQPSSTVPPMEPVSCAQGERADCQAPALHGDWRSWRCSATTTPPPHGREPRRAYERMLAAVESVSIGAIVTWHCAARTSARFAWLR